MRWVVGVVVLLCIVPAGGVVVADAPAASSQESISGALIPLPEPREQARLENINDVADSYGGFQADHVQLLFRDGTPYLVASREPIRPGEATVEGLVFTPSEIEGVDYGLVFAESASVSQSGPTLSAAEYNDSRSEYVGEVVHIDGYYRQAASVEETEGVVFQSQVASVSGGPVIVDNWRRTPAQQARELAIEGSRENGSRFGAAYQQTIPLGSNSVALAGSYNRPAWWVSANATTTVVVLPERPGLAGLWAGAEYVIETDVDDGRKLTPAELRSEGTNLTGELVTVRGQALGTQLSVQETLLELAGCAPQSVTVSSSCVPLPVDVSVHSGVVVRGDAPAAAVPYVGLSSAWQDTPATVERGEYRLTGRVVASDRVDARLDAPVALVLYERERVGDLDASAIGATAGEQSDRVSALLRNQTNASAGEYSAYAAAARATPTPTPTATATATASPTPTDTATPTMTDTRTTTPTPSVTVNETSADEDESVGIGPFEYTVLTLTEYPVIMGGPGLAGPLLMYWGLRMRRKRKSRDSYLYDLGDELAVGGIGWGAFVFAIATFLRNEGAAIFAMGVVGVAVAGWVVAAVMQWAAPYLE